MQNQIKSITFKNLFSYGNKWQEFSPEGICFITGHNKNNDRRNFTGKSNLLKIFPFALYGKVEGLNKSRVVNWKNRKNAESYITVQKGNDEYVIHRGIRPDILAVTKNGKELPKPANKKDFQNQIEDEILQMDYQSFMQTVYADNSNESILNMSKPNKRQFLENIFDLHYYTDLRDKANKKNNSVYNKISNLNTTITETEQRIQDAKKLQDDYQGEKYNLPNSSSELQNKKKYLDDNEEVYKNTVKKIDDLSKESSSLNNNFHKLDNTKTKIKYKIKELTTNHIVKDQSIENIDDVKQKIDQKKQSIEDNQTKIRGHEKELQSFSKDLDIQKDNIIDELTNLKAEHKHADSQYKESEKRIKNKLTDAKCPTCLQDVDHKLIEDHLEQEKEKWETNRDSAKKSVDKKQSQLSEIKEDITAKQKLDDDIKGLQDDVKAEQEEVTELNDKITEIKEKQKKIEKSDKYLKIINKLKKCFESHLIKHKEIQKQVKDNETELSNLDPVKKDYEDCEIEIDKLKISVDNERQQKKKLEQWIENSKQQQDKLSKQIKDDKAKIARLNNIQDYIKCVKDICSDDRARAYSISQKIPLLNQRTNHYLNKADVQYYIRLNNWLDVEIKGPGINKDCTYQNLSGAERGTLNHSLRFALHDINKLQSPSYFSLMILDEILDSALDDIGLKNIADIIQAKQKQDQSDVLIVSHKQSFKEMDDLIDNYYVAEFYGGYSHIHKV